MNAEIPFTPSYLEPGGGGGEGGQGVRTLPEKSQNKGFFSNTGPDPLKNSSYQANINVGPSTA